MKKSHKIILILLGLGLLTGIFAPKIVLDTWPWEIFKSKPDFETMETAYTLSVDELYDAFELDEKAATLKYQGQPIEVSGKIESVDTIQDGQIQIVLTATNALFGGLKAQLHPKHITDPAYQIKLKGLASGENITLKGQCVGFNMEVEMNNCFIKQ
jgi:putative nucleic acid binding protein